ncbi:MAG: hypothetical protein ACI8ZB_004338 [Desulforhopalus sp.]
MSFTINNFKLASDSERRESFEVRVLAYFPFTGVNTNINMVTRTKSVVVLCYMNTLNVDYVPVLFLKC